MPAGAKKINVNLTLNTQVIMEKWCIFLHASTAQWEFRRTHDEKQLSEKMVQLLHKGGYEVIYPENLNNLCCGMAFSSKGYTKAGEKKSDELEAA